MILKTESEQMDDYLRDLPELDFNHPEIRSLAGKLQNDCGSDIEYAEEAYLFVRDRISHSWDIEAEEVTCSALEVLRAGHGNCCGKANLLTALLRMAGIPCGFSLQFLLDEGKHIVHGLNCIYIEQLNRWIRLDARGNKAGVNAQFSTGEEKLAWPVDPEMGEMDYPIILKRFPLPILKALEESTDRQQLQPRWRSELTREQLYPLLP